VSYCIGLDGVEEVGTYNVSVSGSRCQSCKEPVFDCWIVSEPSSSVDLVSERRYVPTTKLFWDAGQNWRQLGG
jgi:hypothetical protein